MSINKIVPPNHYPVNASDYQAQNNQINEIINRISLQKPVLGSFVKKGFIFNFAGVLYKSNSDTAISGTPSKYVKITPSSDGSTCLASFSANLDGVYWNNSHNGYYDEFGNLFLFDEIEAVNSLKFYTLNQLHCESFIAKNTAIAGGNVFYSLRLDYPILNYVYPSYNLINTLSGPIKYISKYSGQIRSMLEFTGSQQNTYYRILKNSVQIYEYLIPYLYPTSATIQYDISLNVGDIITFQVRTNNGTTIGFYGSLLELSRG